MNGGHDEQINHELLPNTKWFKINFNSTINDNDSKIQTLH